MTALYEDIDTVIENIKMAIKCPLGKFYPNKDYGRKVIDSCSEGELLALSRLATREIDGVYIKNVSINNNEASYTILINDDERSVTLSIE